MVSCAMTRFSLLLLTHTGLSGFYARTGSVVNSMWSAMPATIGLVLDELELSLRHLEVVGFFKAARTAKHCDVLHRAQECLNANDIAVANAVELAEGHADLAVLLLEPADTERWSLPEHGKGAWRT